MFKSAQDKLKVLLLEIARTNSSVILTYNSNEYTTTDMRVLVEQWVGRLQLAIEAGRNNYNMTVINRVNHKFERLDEFMKLANAINKLISQSYIKK